MKLRTARKIAIPGKGAIHLVARSQPPCRTDRPYQILAGTRADRHRPAGQSSGRAAGTVQLLVCSSADAVAGGDPVLRAHLVPDGLLVGTGVGGVGAAGAEAAAARGVHR